MILYSKVITPPTSEPVTVDEVKTHLKIDGTDEDDFLEAKIITARQMCERYSNLSFLTQQREIKLDRFPYCKQIEIPYGPVQTIDDFTYLDSDGNAVDLVENTDFILDNSSDLARVEYVNSWPSGKCQFNSVVVAYTAGYANDDHDPIPGIIKEAILKTVARLYEKRGDNQDGPVLSDDIIDMLDLVKVYHNANV